MRAALPVLLALLGGGCEAEPDEALADGARYRAALHASDPAEAVRHCREIREGRLRQECLVFEAADLMAAGGDGEGVCAGIEEDAWREVCYFELVDRGRVRGEAALAACQRAGVFRVRCAAHVLQREESRLIQQFPPGQEAALEAHIRGLVEQYGLADATEEQLDVVMVGRMISERKRRTAAGAPLSRADCGSAGEAACQEAYRMLVLRAGGAGRVPEDCSLPMDTARIAALGLPLWEAELQGAADGAWAHLCRRQSLLHHKPPDHQNTLRIESEGRQ